MTGWTRRDLPADIHAFGGDFGPGAARQPLVFAHLLDEGCPLDFDGVEVIATDHAEKRLNAYFAAPVVAEVIAAAGAWDTIVLILPTAYEGLTCPLAPTARLTALGQFRGTIPRLIPDGAPP